MASVFKRGGKGNRGGSYYVTWYDHTGKRQTKSAKTTDKATAERIVAKYEADAALRREGVIDPALDEISKESQRSIESHLADHESKLQAANRSEKHIASTAQFIRWIAEHAGFQTAADISADGVTRYAGKLRNEGRAARTIQAHLSAIKAFTKWLTEHQKLPRDPLASVKKPNPKIDRRRERRMLLSDEWRWLKSVTMVSGESFGIAAGERVLLYTTAIETGLRSSELRSVTRGRLFLDAEKPFITCKAVSTKTKKKDARQYIGADLAAGLRAHIATKSPKAPVFAMPDETDVAAMLRADLAAARREWIRVAKHDPDERLRREQSVFLLEKNHEGEVLDFHSLRHTTGAWLALAGVHPKTIQTVMRHSQITLTMDTYGHMFPGQEADAVTKLQDMLAGPPEAMQATGTDDVAAVSDSKAQRQAQQSGRDWQLNGASTCDERSQPAPQGKSPKPLRIADLGDGLRAGAMKSKSSGAGTRTPDTRIMIPLL